MLPIYLVHFDGYHALPSQRSKVSFIIHLLVAVEPQPTAFQDMEPEATCMLAMLSTVKQYAVL